MNIQLRTSYLLRDAVLAVYARMHACAHVCMYAFGPQMRICNSLSIRMRASLHDRMREVRTHHVAACAVSQHHSRTRTDNTTRMRMCARKSERVSPRTARDPAAVSINTRHSDTATQRHSDAATRATAMTTAVSYARPKHQSMPNGRRTIRAMHARCMRRVRPRSGLYTLSCLRKYTRSLRKRA
jgi:hypothetical protein